ncbi:transposase [Candidatus Peregrinibacteria bacterium]|nr:transposase [Candidatus Peregrinibacteria bacterium]
MERIGRLYRVPRLGEHYRDRLSGYDETTAPEELFFPENLGEKMAIDETSLIKGELYSLLTNKSTGKLVALMRGTKAAEISDKLMKHLSVEKRMKVEEVTLDMDDGFDWVVRQCFPNAEFIVDRFHVQKLVTECMQALRITERQKILTQRREAKKTKQSFRETAYENGDTPRQLLARSRYLLFKQSSSWTESQKARAIILFREYPDMLRAYALSQQLKKLYDKQMTRDVAATLLRQWCEDCEASNIPEMQDAAASVLRHEGRILNFWNNRATNAFAESFNAKIKGFRGMLRGIKDTKFFLFRCQVYFS